MNKKELIPEQAGSAATEQQYVAPNIEVIDIEISQNILQGGSTGGDYPVDPWQINF